MKNILYKYILMKTKNNISHTPPKNKINPQKNKNNNTNSLKKINTQPQKGNGNKDKTKSDKKKNIGQKIKETAVNISKIALPLGIALILFQNRETISKKLKPHWDEWVKRAGVLAKIEKCANDKYIRNTVFLKFGLERKNDPVFKYIYNQCFNEHWDEYKKQNGL